MLVIPCNITSSGVLVRVYFLFYLQLGSHCGLKHHSDTFYLHCSSSCCRSSPWRVVVLHVLSASRFLTSVITQLPLLRFPGQSFVRRLSCFRSLAIRYSVITLCFSVRTNAFPSFLQSSPSTHRASVLIRSLQSSNNPFLYIAGHFTPLAADIACTPSTPHTHPGITHARF